MPNPLDRSYPEPEPIEGARYVPIGHGQFAATNESLGLFIRTKKENK